MNYAQLLSKDYSPRLHNHINDKEHKEGKEDEIEVVAIVTGHRNSFESCH